MTGQDIHAEYASGSGDPQVVHRPRTTVGRAAAVLSPAARMAGKVALERQSRQRLVRMRQMALDSARERWRASRPRMRSLTVSGGARTRWREVPTPPPPGPHGAVVAPLAMATCDLDRPTGLGKAPFPLPLHLGHECVGEVLEVGAEVGSVRPGDRVAVPFQISCGRCAACAVGLTGNCRAVPPISMYGFGLAGGAWGGVFAEQVAVPFADGMLVPLPAGVDPSAVASVGDTLSDAYRHIAPHLERIRSHPDGPRILILGAVNPMTPFSASMPLYAALTARAIVPEASVLVVDARPAVRAHAGRLGIDAGEPNRLRHERAPLVIDSSADPRGLALAIGATAPDGICSCAGTLHASVRVPGTLMFGRNITLALMRSHIRTVIPAVLDLVARGRLHPEQVTTTVASFEDAPEALRAHLLGGDTKTVLVR
jgi:alcohol dehydrogenase